MGDKFSSGKNSPAMCDICGFRYKLSELKNLVVKTKQTGLKACPECWDSDHPQLQLGMYPVSDPQAVREPRPDNSYYAAEGSRVINWGWNPVGQESNGGLTPNTLIATVGIGTVTVTTT